MAKRVGRPTTKKTAAAKKHAAAEKARYDKLSPAKKKAIVATRDKAAQRKADEKRAEQPQRKAYRRQDAKGVQGVPKGRKCSKCGSTSNVQRHVVNGKFQRYLCAKCNTNAIGGK